MLPMGGTEVAQGITGAEFRSSASSGRQKKHQKIWHDAISEFPPRRSFDLDLSTFKQQHLQA